MQSLSGGFLNALMADSPNLVKEPILQIIAVRPIGDKNDGFHRARLHGCDGEGTFANIIVTSEDPIPDLTVGHPIVQLGPYTREVIGGKLVLIASEVKVLDCPQELLYPNAQQVVLPVQGSAPAPVKVDTPYNPAPPPLQEPNRQPPPVRRNVPAPALNVGGKYTGPIATGTLLSLTPYQNRWTVRVRVQSKDKMRTWNKPNSSGKLFSMTLADETGEMRATAFKAEADKFFGMMEEGNMYMVSGGTIKQANKQWTSVQNDYELTFNGSTTVVPCKDTSARIARIYNFVNVDELETHIGKMVDVIAIARSCSEVQEITTKDGRQLKKRSIVLVDMSDTQVEMTLWAEKAEEFVLPLEGPTVLACKGVSVREFNNGITLSASNAAFEWNPNLEQSHALAGWWEAGAKDKEARTLSATQSTRPKSTQPILLAEHYHNASADRLYFTMMGTVTRVLTDPSSALYRACGHLAECRKKVTDVGDGRYRCEKCNVETDKFKWAAILNVEMTDMSGGHVVSLFSEKVEVLTGKTIDEIGTLKETDLDAYQKVWDSLLYKRFSMNVMGKTETYNDEARAKWTVLSVSPVNTDMMVKAMEQTIQRMRGM